MWVRCALAVAAIALATCVSAKPGSAKYAECRKQLARQPREEPQGRQSEERSIWSSRNPFEFSCKFWGYTPGTRDWADCIRNGELNDARRKEQEQTQKQLEEQQMSCLRNGTGLITSLGGSTFQVSCHGRTFLCPGSFGCPVCPGGIGCPPQR